MSYTSLYIVNTEGDVITFHEFRNSYRGAYMLWDYLCKTYLNLETVPIMKAGETQKLWDLRKDPRLSEAERIAHMSTFDEVMVRKENMHRLAAAFAATAYKMGDPGHWEAHAKIIALLADRDDILGVCWNQTSVSCTHWYTKSDPDGDEWEPYNIFQRTDHWYLFDELEVEEQKHA